MTGQFKRTLFDPTATTPWLAKVILWLFAGTIVGGLSLLRVATDAEFAFASALILPVLAVAWFANKSQGIICSALAAVVWVSADIHAEREFSAAWIPWVNGITRFGVYALVAYLTASLREILIRESELARHDPLTGLLNRRSFFDVGNSETSRAKRYGHPLAIAFLDLDDFKSLNDSRGHEVGDEALRAVSAALLQVLRRSDSVARLGGDEFSVMLPEISFQDSTETGQKIANAINASLERFAPVSVSIGIAWFETVLDDFPAMMATADRLMYELKAEGKNGVRAKRISVHDATPDVRQAS